MANLRKMLNSLKSRCLQIMQLDCFPTAHSESEGIYVTLAVVCDGSVMFMKHSLVYLSCFVKMDLLCGQ